MDANPAAQYATDANLRARQVLWEISPREPPFLLFPWVLGLADIRDGDRVLEVGCGNGGYLALAEAVGLDRSVGMVRSARERALGPSSVATRNSCRFAMPRSMLCSRRTCFTTSTIVAPRSPSFGVS